MKKVIRSAPKKALRTAGAGKRPKAVKAERFVVVSCMPGECRKVELGGYHGFTSMLHKYNGSHKPAILFCGCREFTRSRAIAHWKGGQNPSGDPRPRAAELIRRATAAAKAVGWSF